MSGQLEDIKMEEMERKPEQEQVVVYLAPTQHQKGTAEYYDAQISHLISHLNSILAAQASLSAMQDWATLHKLNSRFDRLEVVANTNHEDVKAHNERLGIHRHSLDQHRREIENLIEESRFLKCNAAHDLVKNQERPNKF
jgi:hypothetical protein